jgi:hypothetical protein
MFITFDTKRKFYLLLTYDIPQQLGHAIAEAVSRWLPTAAGRVRARFWSSGICGGQSGVGAGFLRVLRFPLPKPFHSTNFYIITITRGSQQRPCDELITRRRSPAETGSFTDAAKAQNWAVEPQEEKIPQQLL